MFDVAKHFHIDPNIVWDTWCFDELYDAIEYIDVCAEIEQRKIDASQPKKTA